MGSIDHPEIQARDVRLRLREGAAELTLAALTVAGRRYSEVRLRCEPAHWAAGRLDCPAGRLQSREQPQAVPVRFAFSPASGEFSLSMEPAAGESWHVQGTAWGADKRLELELRSAQLERIRPWIAALDPIAFAGRVDGRLSLTARGAVRQLTGALQFEGVSIASADGRRAAERLAGSLGVDALGEAGAWRGEARLDWRSGEAYWAPWYLADRPLRVTLKGSASAAGVDVSDARASLEGVGELNLRANWSRRAGALRALTLETGALDLAAAGALFVAPLVAEAGLPRVDLAGRAAFTADWRDGSLCDVSATLDGVGVEEGGQRFGIEGLTGRLAWSAQAATEARLRVAGGHFRRLPLGEFEIPLLMQGMDFQVPRLEVPLLDGALAIEGLRLSRRADAWDWQAGGALYPISMSRLTEALGLPRMAGRLSAALPRLSYAASTLSLEGALVVQVFDGYVSATGLKLIEPLGRAPRLTGDLEIRHVDLGQLTETFSFGSITGYVDGEVKDLELTHWRPRRFDARIASSPGDYRKRISQRAVENISALGGASAAAAIQRSFLRFFEEFGYARLGLSCRLRDNVCRMDGIEPAGDGYVIVKGGGLPAINVIGYNRSVDWNELLSRLERVTDANTRPVIE